MFEVNNRLAQPYAVVCYISCTWADGMSASGSGVMVGANDVLTAHHVVFDADHGGYATSVTVTPAADTYPSFVAPFGSFSNVGSISARTSNWDTNYNRTLTDSEAQYDLALLGMTTQVGYITGWLAPAAYGSDFSGLMAGYPAYGTGMMAEAVFADASSSYGVFDIYSGLGPGASGGPLLRTTAGGTEVVGVLSSGNYLDTESTYAALFGPGNLSWLTAAMTLNNSVLGSSGPMQTPVIPDDQLASIATLGSLTAGVSRTGTLETNLDADWFRITLSAGTYRFDAKAYATDNGSLFDPYLTLYNSNGVSLASDDDMGAGLDASLTYTVTAAGTYYVGVRSATGATAGAGTYAVSATSVASGGGGSAIGASARPFPTHTGTSFADVLTGTAGNDVLYGLGGNDTLNGAGGIDTAYYVGTRNEYRVSKAGSNFTVYDTLSLDGTDTLVNVERISFSDRSVNLTIGANSRTISAGQLKTLEELYVAFFNRVPDADGLSYWIDQARAGQSVNSIADAFYTAALLYPTQTGYTSSMSNGDFVNLVYRNVLGRSEGADAQGLAYWSGALASGAQSRGALVTSILDSAHTFKGSATFGYVANLLDNKALVAQRFAVEQGVTYNTPELSISNGMAIAAAVTSSSTAAAISLIGITDGFSTV